MKYHKIRNVDMEVCTVEQMIAYNMAFRAHINHQSYFDKAREVSAICESEAVMKIRDISMKSYRSAYDYKPGKYNEDAIFSALTAGLADYLKNPFIASDYEKVGKAFPAHYLKQ